MKIQSALATTLLAGAVSLLLVACGGVGPPPEGLLLPVGDATAGRAAFVELRCHTCHLVANQLDIPEPVSANRGPAVGDFAPGQTREQYALSIISPSHWVAPPRDSLDSHMGDFRDVMTIAQLIDIVSWLAEQQQEATD